MKLSAYIVLVLLFLLPNLTSGQVADDFSDGNFSQNPTWEGSTGQFLVNSSKLLQLNGNYATDTAYLATGNSLINDIEWSFYVRLAFSPSSNNYVKIYLVSDHLNLKAPLNGYFIKIGEDGTKDAIEFYKQAGSTITRLGRFAESQVTKSNNLIRFKISRSQKAEWKIFVDLLGNKNYQLIGTVTDPSFTNTQYFGFSCRYTSGNRTRFYFDDVNINTISSDVTPPKLDSAKAIDDSNLDVFLSENMALSTAQNINNYSVNNNIGKPATATLDPNNKSIVHLAFTKLFANGVTNTLTVNNLEDEAQNVLQPNSTALFNYIDTHVPQPGDVVINEIFADPSPSVDLPTVEFVELFNTTNASFNLKNWKYTDGSSTVTLTNKIIYPKEYLILCPIADTALYKPFGKTMGLVAFPSLNNTGDKLKLFSKTNLAIDSAYYTDKWYKDNNKQAGGWTLERINPYESACVASSNWKASEDPSGGTPGKQNSIFNDVADSESPVIENISVIAKNCIQVCFNESIDSTSTFNINNYSINPGGLTVGGVKCVSPDYTCILLYLNSNMEEGITYQLIVNNIRDCKGNIGNTYGTFSIISKGKPGDVVINELMIDPTPAVDLPEKEYIELYNRSNTNIDLTGWKIRDATSEATLGRTTLAPGEYLILCDILDTATFNTLGNTSGVKSLPSLNNDKDSVYIYNADGVLIDFVFYDDSWYHDEGKQSGGWSIERIDPNFLCLNAENWHASYAPKGGTPGLPNSQSGVFKDNKPPYILSIDIQTNNRLKLFFSESMNEAALQKENYLIDNGIGQPFQVQSAQITNSSVILYLNTPLTAGQLYTLSLLPTIKDCAGNALESLQITFGIAQQADSGDVVINELLYDPNINGYDFVELYNRSNKIIDIKNLYIGNVDKTATTSYIQHVITNNSYLMLPNSYVVITANPDAVREQYYCANKQAFIKAVDMPTFVQGKGVVTLTNKSLQAVDLFYYNDKLHFNLLNSTKGVSLERISPERPTNIVGNWHSAAETVGFGTPTYKNSQQSEVGQDDVVNVEPNIFSPDNDGYNDVVNIHFKLDAPGNLVTLQIFDARGRLVRTLLNNQLFGNEEATVSWDGITETGQKANIGIYVIYIEATDKQNNIGKFKKTCVLASKLGE